ncbi:PC4 domain-containing protein [Trichonephila clavipes]|nr:PC4 domain-containing protein [Trichonephila clavipes]
MITNFFLPELNNHDVQELWYEQDGATCHTARATIDLLKDTFGDRLISRFGPVNWPPRSCDLTPLDYFLWGYVKSLLYADKPQTLDHLEDNICRVIADIRSQMLEKSSKIGRPDWTTSEPAVAVLCQKSYLKLNWNLFSYNHETCYTSRIPNSRDKRVCFDKDNGKVSSFKPDAVSENHFHLGGHNYAVVSDFACVARIHLRRYKLDATGSLLPTKDRITVTPSVWLALVREFAAIDQAFDDGKVFIIKDCPNFPNCYRKCDLYHMSKLFPAKGLFSQIFDSSFQAKKNGMECIKRYPKADHVENCFNHVRACFSETSEERSG